MASHVIGHRGFPLCLLLCLWPANREPDGQTQVLEFSPSWLLCSEFFDLSTEGNWVKITHMPSGLASHGFCLTSLCLMPATKSPSSISNGYSPVSTDPETTVAWGSISESCSLNTCSRANREGCLMYLASDPGTACRIKNAIFNGSFFSYIEWISWAPGFYRM